MTTSSRTLTLQESKEGVNERNAILDLECKATTKYAYKLPIIRAFPFRLRHYVTRQKVTRSIPDIIGSFN
jgi:hypothetical protein